MTTRLPLTTLNRRHLFGSAAAVAVVGLAACSSETSGGASDGGGGSDGGSDGTTRTLTDATGTTVEVPVQPSKVVSLHYAGSQAMIDLGLTPIGTGPAGQGGGGDEESYVPADIWKKLKDVPIVLQQQEPKIEEIAALGPDLILAPNIVEDDVLAQLRRVAPVFQFTLRGGKRADWQQRVREVADALNRETQLEELTTAWEGELGAAAANYADVTAGLVVGVIASYEEGNFYAWGEDNMQGTILMPLGITWSPMENAAVAAEKEPEATISNERLLEVVGDAQVLFYDTNLKDEPSATMVAVQQTSLYQQLPAVLAGHAYPFGKNTIAGFSDARAVLLKVSAGLDAYLGA